MEATRAVPATDHYPDGVVPDDDALLAVLREVIAALRSEDVPHLLIGGIGSFALARPRVTHDIDVFVRPDAVDRSLAALERAGFETGIHDPAWLAKGHKGGVLVDVIFRSTGDIYLDAEMMERSQTIEYKGVSAEIVAPEDLLVIKALATTEHTFHHWYDALAIISRCDLDWHYALRRATQAGPRRVLSLLVFAESCDFAVPSWAVSALYEILHGGER